MEKQIKIAYKLYQCRDAAKRFYKDEFASKIEPYKECIRKYMLNNGSDEMTSVIEICNIDEIKQKGDFCTIMFMAAAVELIEPSA